MRPHERRIVLLTNSLSLILLSLSLLLALSFVITLGLVIQVYLVLITCLFYLWVLVLNRSGHLNFSRLAICIFVPTATMFITVMGKINKEQVEEFSFLSSRLVLLITALLPLILFRLQERNKLVAGLSVNFFYLVLHTSIHGVFGVSYYQLGFSSPYYKFLNLLFIILYVLFVAAFIYYKNMLKQTEDELMAGHRQLNHLYEELGIRHEEIFAQAEKLTESQQKLQEANQLIEQQKELLQAENLQLHQHLLEKNKILDASNRELHKRLEELQQFSYTISHNLRGPVASLLGLCSLFNMERADPENRELMSHAKSSAAALDRVILDLSKVLQIQEGRQVSEPVNLEQLLENVLLSLKGEIESAEAEVFHSLEVRQVQSVKPYLYSIFYNLISNALRYKHPDRSCYIKIETRPSEGGVRLLVEDNGMGIDLVQHGHQLFKMYKRFHEGKEGRGLGLYLIKTQAEIMGGHVEVKSQPGEGTTFSIWLPRLSNGGFST
jgi:signal transduction histidine kinase